MTYMMASETDIAVVGSGPAGAVAALELARLGHNVSLLERATFPRSHVGESLPPGIWTILDDLGVRPRIESAGFLRPRRAMVRWAQASTWEKHLAGELGLQVDRGLFDKILCDAAVAAGARLVQPARVMRPVHHGPQFWSLPVWYQGCLSTLSARFLIDASGKRSLWRVGKRRMSAPTTAIYAYWHQTALQGPETRVEAGDNAWFWGAPLPDGRVNATVFVDPQRCAAHARHGLTPFYESLLNDSMLLRGCLAGRRVSEVQVCDAASYTATSVVGADWVKVGEAAFGIDPLSSQGVQTAMYTGLQGARVAHTILRKPANTPAAMAFYEARRAEMVARHQAIASRYYREQYQFCPAPFWHRRSLSEEESVGTVSWAQPASSPALHDTIAVSEATSITQTPVIQDAYITYHPALTHPALDRPVAFVQGAPVVPLLRFVGQGRSVRELLDRWSQEMPVSRAGDMLQWLWTRGVLVRNEACRQKT